MKQTVLTILILIVTMTTLFAFDGKKKGFLLGFGVGAAGVSYSQTIEGEGDSITSDTEEKGAFATDFKIGYAPSNNLEIYYTNQVAWFTMHNALDDDTTIVDGVTAVGASYFLSQSPTDPTFKPSPFISFGLGLSSWSSMNNDGNAWTGVGYFLGVGYEFSKHNRISLNLFGNNPSIEESGVTFTTNSKAFLLTYSLMAY
ncbi:MAG: hypothetical protein JXR56_03895 [Candidatus Cloacimonetes bacterium]|nr:hypothetical protein [Candidatus Cloacimonadota bacterium]